MIISRRTAILSVYRKHIAMALAYSLPEEVAVNLPQPTVVAIVQMFTREWARGRLRDCSSLRYCEACGKVWLNSFRPSACPQCSHPAGVSPWSINHQVLRRYIRKAELDAGLLMPKNLPFTHRLYPRSFDMMIKAYRLKHRTSMPIDYDIKMEEMDEQRREDARERFKRQRTGMLTWKMHQWEPGVGPRLSLWELARKHTKIKEPASREYKAIKDAWVSNNISGREAIETVLR